MDYFGKLDTDLVLQDVGLDGFDSYYVLSDWGLDLLKLDPTLGLGSIGRYANDSVYRFQETGSVTCVITENGLLGSEIVTKYFGWTTEDAKTILTSVISIIAGTALTKHTVKFTNSISGICTGIVKSEGEDFVDKVEDKYRLLATYGDFRLNSDKIGLAVIVENRGIEKVYGAAGSHVVTFNPAEQITYYLIGVWQEDTSGVDSMELFEMLLEVELAKLNSPLIVTK